MALVKETLLINALLELLQDPFSVLKRFGGNRAVNKLALEAIQLADLKLTD
jgi:hypothetical protein